MKILRMKAAVAGLSMILAPLVGNAEESADINGKEMTLLPTDEVGLENHDYSALWAIVNQESPVQYGTPIIIQVRSDEEKPYLNVSASAFDGYVVRVSLDELLVQPNRINPPDQP